MKMVAVVGTDGAGKSSVTKAILAELSKSHKVRLVDKWDVLDSARYPEYAFLKQDLRELRRCVSDMQEVTRTLFLFWALHGTLKPDVVNGTGIVLLDGYWPKHGAAEAVYSGQFDLVECLIGLMPKPDLTIFLDVGPDVAYARRASDPTTSLVSYECGHDRSLSRESFIAHQTKIKAILHRWCDTFGWKRFNADADAETMRSQVLEAIRAL